MHDTIVRSICAKVSGTEGGDKNTGFCPRLHARTHARTHEDSEEKVSRGDDDDDHYRLSNTAAAGATAERIQCFTCMLVQSYSTQRGQLHVQVMIQVLGGVFHHIWANDT